MKKRLEKAYVGLVILVSAPILIFALMIAFGFSKLGEFLFGEKN